MPRLHALELLPDDAGCDVVRRDWQALRDAGLPSQLDHSGTTNAPHLTLLAAPTGEQAAERAVDQAADQGLGDLDLVGVELRHRVDARR